MGRHVGNTVGRHLPVTAEGISAVVVIGLPAVVHNQGLHSHLDSLATFGLDGLRRHLLVELVPGGIERCKGHLGHMTGEKSRFGSHPLGPFAHGIGPKYVASIQQDLGLIVCQRGFGSDKELQTSAQQGFLFAQSEETVDLSEASSVAMVRQLRLFSLMKA